MYRFLAIPPRLALLVVGLFSLCAGPPNRAVAQTFRSKHFLDESPGNFRVIISSTTITVGLLVRYEQAGAEAVRIQILTADRATQFLDRTEYRSAVVLPLNLSALPGGEYLICLEASEGTTYVRTFTVGESPQGPIVLASLPGPVHAQLTPALSVGRRRTD